MCLLAHTSGTWEAQQPGGGGSAQLLPEPSDGSGSLAAGVATPPAGAGTPARPAGSSSELPSIDASPAAAGGGSEPSPSPPPPEAQGSQAERFRRLMDAWQAGRGSPAPGPSPQQAPEPPSAAASQPASPLSGACLGLGLGPGPAVERGASCSSRSAKLPLPGRLRRVRHLLPCRPLLPPLGLKRRPLAPLAWLGVRLPAEDTLCSLLAAFQLEEEEPLRALDPGDAAALVSRLWAGGLWAAALGRRPWGAACGESSPEEQP